MAGWYMRMLNPQELAFLRETSLRDAERLIERFGPVRLKKNVPGRYAVHTFWRPGEKRPVEVVTRPFDRYRGIVGIRSWRKAERQKQKLAPTPGLGSTNPERYAWQRRPDTGDVEPGEA